jgi:3',5'-cyclic AMP phosphodiesterase CpdA
MIHNPFRQVLLIGMALFFTVVFNGSSQPTETARGRVFNDLNKNGKFDPGEVGISGVMVSNQLDVVETDANGFFSLPVTNPSVIFLTKPAGYRVPLDENNIPQFYYIHYPDGSPALEHAAIEPTGALPREILFPLYADKVHKDFSVLVIADVQTANPTELEYFRSDVVATALEHPFDLVISLGDLVHDDPGLFPEYARSMALLGTPVYNVLGNHDVNYDGDEASADDSYIRLFGPPYYSFDEGNVHFVILENVERFCKKGDREAYWDCYRGKVGTKQLEWLENDLARVPPDKKIVVNQHIAFVKDKNAGERDRIVNRQEVFHVLENRQDILVLAGHRHTLQHDYFSTEDGWNGTGELHQIICSSASGTWWTGPADTRGIPSTTQIDGVPNGFFILGFGENDFIHNYYPAGNIREQIRIELPNGKTGIQDQEIVVNVYNSNKHSQVQASIDGNHTVELKNDIRRDPFITESFRIFRDQYKSWASPARSTQMWIGPMPGELTKGFHTIKVTVTDEFGRVYSSFAVFEVV